MKNKILKLAAIPAFMLIISAAAVIAQSAHDQYGFGNRVFVIQSALEAGKSTNGLWDIPGAPNKDDGNLRGTNWLHMGLWQREAGDPEDRVFRFRAAQGLGAGKYFIYVGRSGNNWGITAVTGTGKIEARTGGDYFELKHMGNGRWKIYYKSGMIIAPASPTAKNGTKLVLLPDQNGPHTEWVFFDIATNKSFVPVSTTSTTKPTVNYKGTLKDQGLPGITMNVYQYFEFADGAKFDSENAGGILQAYLNDMNKASDQWSAILGMVKSINQYNKDAAARRSMYLAISQADIQKGSGFAENLLKGQVRKQINDASAAENDPSAKEYLRQIAEKMQ